MENINKRKYTGLFVVIPEKEETFEEVKTAINTIIKENTGEVTEEKVTGKKKLAYPIRKKTEGLYYEALFTAEPGSISKILRLCHINTDIMRAIVDLA